MVPPVAYNFTRTGLFLEAIIKKRLLHFAQYHRETQPKSLFLPDFENFFRLLRPIEFFDFHPFFC